MREYRRRKRDEFDRIMQRLKKVDREFFDKVTVTWGLERSKKKKPKKKRKRRKK